MINDIGLLYCFGLEKDVNFMKNFISAIIITGVGLVTMATGVYASPVSDALRNGVNNKNDSKFHCPDVYRQCFFVLTLIGFFFTTTFNFNNSTTYTFD